MRLLLSLHINDGVQEQIWGDAGSTCQREITTSGLAAQHKKMHRAHKLK